MTGTRSQQRIAAPYYHSEHLVRNPYKPSDGKYAMHVLIVSEYWSPDEQGGGERSAQTLAAGLVKQGWRVSVLTSIVPGLPAEANMDGVRVLRRITTGRPGSIPGNARRLFFVSSAAKAVLLFLTSEPVDIIHLMNTSSIPLARRLRPRVRCPITAHLNSAVPFCPKGDRIRHGAECNVVCSWNEFVPCYLSSRGLGKLNATPLLRYNPLAWLVLYFRYRTYRSALRSVAGWVPIGSGLVSLLRQHGVSAPIRLLPNPVDTRALEALPLPRPGKRIVVGFVGAITEAKGARVLGEALCDLNVTLHVAGTGPLEGELRRLLGDKVRFFGQVKEDKLPAFYAAVDVVVIPSLCAEAFGRVAVEAMAAGREVIASDIGGLKDILGKVGTLVPPGDATRLRESIQRFRVRPAVSRSLRRTVVATYPPPVLCRSLATSLSDAINAHR